MVDVLVQVVNEVKRLAEINPDHVYERRSDAELNEDRPACLYQEDNGKPGCIFGHAFANLGLLNDVLARFPDQVAGIITVIQQLNWCTPEENYSSSRRIEWCSLVQTRQDMGYTWSEAVRYANRDTA